MNPSLSTAEAVERWNDTFARENDIDAYYARSGFLIRAVERRRLTCIQRLAAIEPRHRLLEVGCGGGHVLRLFPEADLTGLDVSGEMLHKAAANLQGLRVRLVKGELGSARLPHERFDRIICSEVLEHTVNPEEILGQMVSLLDPQGIAVITLPNDPLVHRIKHLIQQTRLTVLPPLRRISWGGDHYHLHEWTIAQMHELLEKHFIVTQAAFTPNRFLPIRCCFQCKRRTSTS